MSASIFDHTPILDFFQLNAAPFSSERDNREFFQNFNLQTSQPLTAEQVMVYIQFMLNAAGPDHRIVIENDAHQALYRLSMGRIDQIKIIMERALQRAFAARTRVITKAYLDEAEPDDLLPEERLPEQEPPKNSAATTPAQTWAEKDGTKASKSNPIGTMLMLVALSACLAGAALFLWKGIEGWAPGNQPAPVITKKIHAPARPAPSRTTAPRQ